MSSQRRTPTLTTRALLRLAALATVAALLPSPSAGFSVLDDQGADAYEKAARAPRWSAEPDPFGGGTGLHDGIQVAVDPNFTVGLGGAEVAALYGVDFDLVDDLARAAIRGAFALWQTPELRFEITFDGPAVDGPRLGAELDVFAGPEATQFFGYAQVARRAAVGRLLTNGQRSDGDVIVGADVHINSVRILEGARLLRQIGLSLDLLANALQILLAHEIGHAIGFDHPNEVSFLDTDGDPFNPMPIDPRDPFGDLIVSSIPANPPGHLVPVMWGGLSSANVNDLLRLLQRLDDPKLTYDDIGGRDVLYPRSAASGCAGDCDGNGAVTVDELIAGVNLALGAAELASCPAFDADGDGAVRVDDLIVAINAALGGCGEGTER